MKATGEHIVARQRDLMTVTEMLRFLFHTFTNTFANFDCIVIFISLEFRYRNDSHMSIS